MNEKTQTVTVTHNFPLNYGLCDGIFGLELTIEVTIEKNEKNKDLTEEKLKEIIRDYLIEQVDRMFDPKFETLLLWSWRTLKYNAGVQGLESVSFINKRTITRNKIQ